MMDKLGKSTRRELLSFGLGATAGVEGQKLALGLAGLEIKEEPTDPAGFLTKELGTPITLEDIERILDTMQIRGVDVFNMKGVNSIARLILKRVNGVLKIRIQIQKYKDFDPPKDRSGYIPKRHEKPTEPIRKPDEPDIKI